MSRLREVLCEPVLRALPGIGRRLSVIGVAAVEEAVASALVELDVLRHTALRQGASEALDLTGRNALIFRSVGAHDRDVDTCQLGALGHPAAVIHVCRVDSRTGPKRRREGEPAAHTEPDAPDLRDPL